MKEGYFQVWMKDSRNSPFFNNTLSGALKEKKAAPLIGFSLVFWRPPLDEGGFSVVMKNLVSRSLLLEQRKHKKREISQIFSL